MGICAVHRGAPFILYGNMCGAQGGALYGSQCSIPKCIVIVSLTACHRRTRLRLARHPRLWVWVRAAEAQDVAQVGRLRGQAEG
jgi:hypothetical protein